MKIFLSEEQYSRLVEDTFKWDVEEVKKIISNYKTLYDFRTENFNIYKQIKRRGLIPELLGHLQRGGGILSWDLENIKNIISKYKNLKEQAPLLS